jgi:polyhydroxybutyrate depolymerase
MLTFEIHFCIDHSNTEDPLVPWGGGEIRFGRQKFGKVLSVLESVKFWTTHNQCSSPSNITWEPDRDPKDGTRVRKELYNQCRESSEVVLYGIEGGGHTWPGGDQYLPEWMIGKTSRDIDANEVIWDFFKRHINK